MSTDPIPNTKALDDITKLITSPEAAEYFLTRLEDVFNKAKISDKDYAKDILNSVKEFVEYVKTQATPDIWDGKTPEKSGFINFLVGLASKAAKSMGEKDVEFNYAIGPESEIMRSYTDKKTGESLSKEDTAAMDKVVNAWLAKNGLTTDNGVVKDEQNNLANVDVLKKLLDSIADYVKEKAPWINIEAIQNPFPSDKGQTKDKGQPKSTNEESQTPAGPQV